MIAESVSAQKASEEGFVGDDRTQNKAREFITLGEVISESNFREEQEQEPTFQQVYTENLAKQEEEVLLPDLMTIWSWFEITDSILYWVEKGKVEGMEVAQVLVPQIYQKKLVQIVYILPLGGHLRREKTVAHLSQHVYWPSLHKEVEWFCRVYPACQWYSAIKQAKVPL